MTSRIDTVDLTLLVCTHNRSADLREMLETALAQETRGQFTYEVLVVDNNSTDDTRPVVDELIARGCANLRYLFEPRPGKSHALNAGLAAARGPIYTIADDDFILPGDWLLNIVEGFRMHPEVSYVGGRVLPLWQGQVPLWLGPEHWSCLAIADYGDEAVVVNEKNPICLLACSFRRSDVDAVGGYHPDLGVSSRQIGGIEDLDVCRRLWKAGRSGIYLPRLFFHHKVQRERLSRRYHRRWHMGHGRFYATMRDEQFERSAVRWFDVPGHMYRLAVESSLDWLRLTLRRDSRAAFVAETRIRFFLGFLSERCRQHGARRRRRVRELVNYARSIISGRFKRWPLSGT